MRNLNDDELISLIVKTSNPKYSNVLYARHWDKVYTTCYFWVKDTELAADYTQDIFVKIFLKLDSFSSQSSFTTWVTAISRNYCIDKLRQRRLRPQHLSLEESRLDTDRLGLAEDSQEGFDMSPFLHQLKVEDQQLLQLKYEQEVKIDDLAMQFGLTISAVKMRLQRARARLKAAYERENIHG